MEQCGQCGAPLDAGDRFCGDCGAPLAGCPSCGGPVVAGKRFCKSCGRDRKARHLAVAAHLRQAFPGDGEEITDVIARHYLDALDAVPDDADASEIRGRAVMALTRAAERAARTGAPALAAASYVTAAQLTQADAGEDGSAAAALWECAAEAALTNAAWATAVEQADRSRELYQQTGDARSAARARIIAGRALRWWGRYAQAREQLTAAVEVLLPEPDADTVRALGDLATLEVLAGAPEAEALSAEALALGQDLAVDAAVLAELFTTRGIHLSREGRNVQAAAYLREAARLATQAGDSIRLSRALLNLSGIITGTDPAAGAAAASTAAGHLRQAGFRRPLAVAVMNLSQALLMTGDWDAADAELAQAADGDGLADLEELSCQRAWLAAMRGDTPTAQQTLAGLDDLRFSEDPQDKALIGLAEAFTAYALRQPAAALRHVQTALGIIGAVGLANEYPRWGWPLATRLAHDLADTPATGELLEVLGGYLPGQLAPMLRAERDLVRARQAAAAGDQSAASALAAAVRSLRELSTPYHLAHGLLDHAAFLSDEGDLAAAGQAIDEARGIAQRLGGQPLLERVESMAGVKPRISA